MPSQCKALLFVLAILSFNISVAQTDSSGSGRALQFDGIDDYVDLGNIYDDLTFPFTVAAWVKLKQGETGGPVFISQNNQPIYNGFWFFVTPTSIAIEYGDGRGENLPAFRRGKNAQISNITGRWVHTCAVVRGLSDILLYVNGNLVDGSISGESSLPMASNYPGDVATIGYFLSNGVKYWFKGEIDNVQMYSKELSVMEIRNSMTKKLAGTESAMIGYWNFDETSSTIVSDKTANHFNGTLKGGVARKFSGAPIGDENIYQYGIAAGAEVTLNDFTVRNFQSGIPQGVHVYHVKDIPSQTGGLASVPSNYYGVFLADIATGKTFTLKNSGTGCGISKRIDNSDPNWVAFNGTSSVTDRAEFATISPSPSVDLELGPDLFLCNENQVTLNSSIPSDYGGSFLWSTGETTNSVTVNKTGVYTLEITNGCSTQKDEVQVTFMKRPPEFSLGEDEKTCVLNRKKLQPFSNGEYSFEWQDGSNESSFMVTTFGTYWLIVRNACGEQRDSVTIENLAEVEYAIPNVITPNGDNHNQYFVIKPQTDSNHLKIFNRWGRNVFETTNYQNDWDGHELSAGKYFYTFTPACGSPRNGIISILR